MTPTSQRPFFMAWLAISAVAPLVAQTLPPPTTGGVVDIEVTVGAETRAVQHAYEPPRRAVILTETLRRERQAVLGVAIAQTETIPAQPGATTSTFNFDANYAANHPDVVRPIGGASNGPFFGTNRYQRITLTTTWDGQGTPTFALQAIGDPSLNNSVIEGRGSGNLIGIGPSNLPSPRFHVGSVTRAEGQLGLFSWLSGQGYWFLYGTSQYWAESQADGTTAVFHTNYFNQSFPNLREYYPIGEVTVTGTPGYAAGQRVTYQITDGQPLTEDAAYEALRGAGWTFTGNFELSAGAIASYSFSPNAASASKVRYKIQLQPGLARTVSWTETFTPEGQSEPSDHRFISERVSAGATETAARTLDPFARFGNQPGTYEVVAYDGESLAAALTTDVNGDGKIVSAANPITPYLIANADQLAADGRVALEANLDDSDADGIADALEVVEPKVNGPDDLRQFIPVYLDLSGLVSTLPPTSGFTYKLKQADGALNFVYTNLTPTTAFAYRDAPASGFGPGLGQPAASAPTQRITADGVDLFTGPTGSSLFLEAIRLRDGGIILIEARQATTQPLILSVQKPDGTVLVEIPLPFMASAPPSLAVDANRDGTIKLASEDASDATSATNPYRFWLNDDDDGNALNDEQEVAGGTAKDYESRGDFGIASKRDLEDFARLWLSVQGITAALKRGDLQLGFKWTDGYSGTPKINLYLHYESDGGTKYLTDSNIAAGQTSNPWSATLVSTTNKNVVAPGDVFVLKKGVFDNLTEEQPAAHFLFEGAGEGKGRLQMVILDKNGAPIGEGPGVWMDLASVKSMYQRVKVTPRDPSGIPEPFMSATTFDAGTASTEPSVDGHPFVASTDEAQTALVFVHGSNISYGEAVWNAETMFKRLYWQGNKGRFVLFYWDTLVGAFAGEIPALPYNLNEYRALKYGPTLKSYVATLSQGRTVNVASHSLGAGVVLSALKEGMAVNNYLVLQGAFSAKSYDANLPTLQRFQDAEAGKPTPDMALINGYGGYLANVQGTLINMFNPDDFALATGTILGVETNWEKNQIDSKPDDPVGVGQYNYVTQQPAGYTGPIPLGGSVYYSIFQAAIRPVTDPHESMAFIARTRTKAVGALAGVGGVVSQEVQLNNTTYNFGATRSDHSAEFTRIIQQTVAFYQRVFDSVGAVP